jgi:fructokinase
MYDLVVFGDITIDLYFKGRDLTHDKDRFHLAYGGKYYAEEFHQSIGGSGGNVAINGSILGLNSAVVAKVGETGLKNVIIQYLVKKNVSTEFLIFDKVYTSISTILLGDDGERTIIKYNDPKENFPLNPTATDRIKRSGIIFMGNLHDISLSDRIATLKSVDTPENLIALNLGAQDCEAGVTKMKPLLEYVDALFVNKHEFSLLVNKKADMLDLKENQLTNLDIDLDMLIITDSKNGSFAYTKEKVYYEPAAKIKAIIDATGAGDAFTSAYLAQYKRTQNIQSSLQSGTENAARVLKKIGAH